jgi:hypothetical protein
MWSTSVDAAPQQLILSVHVLSLAKMRGRISLSHPGGRGTVRHSRDPRGLGATAAITPAYAHIALPSTYGGTVGRGQQ